MKRIPKLRPGTYGDGLPLHEVGFADAPQQIREVLFMDTADNRLYEHAFILRRRIRYEDGFPSGDPEIVFKFRHPNLQKAAETDVRPQIAGDYRIKFKAEALPLEHTLGVRERGNPLSMASMMAVFPPLQRLKASSRERVELVSHTIVEEVLQDIGVLDFGEGMSALANVALWRVRGDHRPLIGEFAFEFKRRADLRERPMARAQAFFASRCRARRRTGSPPTKCRRSSTSEQARTEAIGVRSDLPPDSACYGSSVWPAACPSGVITADAA